MKKKPGTVSSTGLQGWPIVRKEGGGRGVQWFQRKSRGRQMEEEKTRDTGELRNLHTDAG